MKPACPEVSALQSFPFIFYTLSSVHCLRRVTNQIHCLQFTIYNLHLKISRSTERTNRTAGSQLRALQEFILHALYFTLHPSDFSLCSHQLE